MIDFWNQFVTSRSGALTKLIPWGHLLSSDMDFYDDEPPNLDDDALWLMTGCFTIAVYRCYWLSFIECAGFRTMKMQRHRWNSLGLRIESGSGIFELFHLQWHCFDLIICYWFMTCCWLDLTWWLMMQADDSLLTRLTYGVKGTHTSSREVEGEGWTSALPPPTSTPAMARTLG